MTNKNTGNGLRTVRANENSVPKAHKPPHWYRRMLNRMKSAWERTSTRAKIGVAVAGACTTAACGGDTVTVETPPIPDPTGVCGNIESRISPEGTARLGLNETMLQLGEVAYLTDDALVRVERMAETLSGTKATLKLVDEDGRSLSNIQDPSDGETIPATSDALAPGDSWTFVVDGVSYTLTVCAIVHTEDGDYVILTSSPGFDWCAPVDRTVPVETETYETNTYGTETINADVREIGEEPRSRDDVECTALSGEIITESAELEVPMAPGVQPEDSRVKILGELWEVIELNASGEILFGKSMVSGLVETGERLVTGVDNLELLVTEVANYDGTYKANLVVSVPGFELELVEGAVAGTLIRVSLPGGDVYVRVNEVNADGTVKLEVLGQARTMKNHGTWTKGETEYGVSLSTEGSNVTGWTLTKQ